MNQHGFSGSFCYFQFHKGFELMFVRKHIVLMMWDPEWWLFVSQSFLLPVWHHPSLPLNETFNQFKRVF